MEVHDLHVWALSSGRNILTSHVVVRDSLNRDVILSSVIDAVSKSFEIHHCTIQMEQAAFHDNAPKPSH